MDILDRVSLNRLVEVQKWPCVSIYMPTHPVGKDGEQDAIRLRKLIEEADKKLCSRGVRTSDSKKLLQQASGLSHLPEFWEHRKTGLAIYISPERFETYRVGLPLIEQVDVGRRFRLRPILPLLEEHLRFYLLTLSENNVHLYSVDQQTIEPISVPDLPENLKDAINETRPGKILQAHAALGNVTGKQAVVFHGQGGKPDSQKGDQLTYCAEVDKAVSAYLARSQRPLLLSGVESLVALYRSKNTYGHLLNETLGGNQDYQSLYELRTAAWQVVQPCLRQQAIDSARRYQDRRGNTVTMDEPTQVVQFAIQGRVDTLFYHPHAELFGELGVTGTAIRITSAQEDDDLVDLAAVETLRHGGSIFSMSDLAVPTNSPLAAILRF